MRKICLLFLSVCLLGAASSAQGCKPGGVLTADEEKYVQAAVDAHPAVVPVFLRKECYDGALGKAFMDQATKQEKAIRFFVVPENLTPEELDAYNKHISVIQREMSKQERGLLKQKQN